MRRGLLIALVALLIAPAVASAHAQLESTVPARGATLQRAPAEVEFRFGENVQAGIGSVRVFDGTGKEVEQGDVLHPGGDGAVVAVKLPASLPDGGYTATYHVISADSHPVSGGFSFSIGTGGAGAQSVDKLLQGATAGAVTATAMGVSRAVQYFAIAVAGGVVLFLLLCWLPGLREVSDARPGWARAAAAFAERLRLLLTVAAVGGFVGSVLGVLLEGAEARGASLWDALRWDLISEILGTRFGTTWGLAALGWLVVLAVTRLRRDAVPRLETATVGATGLALPAVRTPTLALLGVPVALLGLVPAFGGHPSVEHPVWLFLPADVIHILCIAGWMGGIVVLMTALRGATGELEPTDRSRLLAATVGRFSTWAGVAVAAILATGVVQALIEIDAWGELLHTGYGRAVLIKFGLFLGLLGLGWVNRFRVVPQLQAAAAGGSTPGAVGVLLRRTLRTELAVGLVVFAVAGALGTYAPAKVSDTGPVSIDTILGPARLQATLDPARPGVNEMHLYLFDRKSGAQWTQAKELTATASLPSRHIADLPVDLRKAGPGHYVAGQVSLPSPGTWELKVTARVSAFDEYQKTIRLKVR